MNNKKIFIIIFLIAFLMRLAALFSFAEEKSLLYVNDSQTYLQTAKNILEHGVYSMEISETPHPDNFRTPIYPIFLIPFVALKTSLYVPAIVQIIIMSLGAGLVFLLGQKIFSRQVAIIAAILFALEPFGALISAQIMTEAIFTSLFVTSLLLFLLYIKEKKTNLLYLATFLLALSALTRPVAFYLGIVIPLAILLARAENLKIFTKTCCLAIALYFAILSPWLLFITTKVKTFDFSSLSSFDIYAYHGKYFDEWRKQKNPLAKDTMVQIDLSIINNSLDARPIGMIKSVGLEYIKAHFFEYLIYHFSRLPNLYTDSGYVSILNGVPGLNFNSASGGALDSLMVEPKTTYRLLLTNPIYILSFIFDLFFLIIAILALSSPISHYLRYRRLPHEYLFLVFIILVYTFLASPIGGARFRIPINPFLFLLGISAIFDWWYLLKIKTS